MTSVVVIENDHALVEHDPAEQLDHLYLPQVIEHQDLPWAPWFERCDGCDGTGHMGHRIPAQLGPCDSCCGAGRVVFSFHIDRWPAASVVPGIAGARYAWDHRGVR
jgi:hypothetical protein